MSLADSHNVFIGNRDNDFFRIKIALFTILLLLSMPYMLEATTRTAASCNQSDIVATVGQSSPGDTVNVPAGTCSWTSLSISGISLIGAGGTTSGTVITAGTVTLTKSNTNTTRLSGFYFSGSDQSHATAQGSSSARAYIIDNNYFYSSGNNFFISLNANGGLLHHNQFFSPTSSGAPGDNMEIHPNEDWSQTPTFGTADTQGPNGGERNIYLENNTFTNIGCCAPDGDQGARLVIRYNTYDDSGIVFHSGGGGIGYNDTSQTGHRHFEIYNNSFKRLQPVADNLAPSWIWVRGGTGVIANNYFDTAHTPTWGSTTEIALGVGCNHNGSSSDAYPVPFQIGQVAPNGGVTGSTVPPTENPPSHPLLIFGNTGPGTSDLISIGENATGNAGFTQCSDPGNYIQANRDYYTSNKWNWTPFTYPHPLAGNPTCTTPSKLAFTSQPSNAVLGAGLGTVSVSVEDASGNVCTSAATSITLSKDTLALWGTLSASNNDMTKSAVNGAASWTDLSVTGLTGLGSIDAAASGLSNAVSNSISISNTCTPNKLVFTAQPSGAAMGASLGTVSVTIEDSGGNVCSAATNSITLSKDASATWGTLNSSSNLTKAAIGGVAIWTDLYVTGTAGSGSIDANANGLVGAVSNSLAITVPCTQNVAIGTFTLCGETYNDVSTGTQVQVTYSPGAGNAIIAWATWCYNSSCNTSTAGVTAKIGDNLNATESCFTASPHSPFITDGNGGGQGSGDFQEHFVWFCPSIPSGVTTFTVIPSSTTLSYLQLHISEWKAGALATSCSPVTACFENVDNYGQAGNTTGGTTATISTNGPTVYSNDLVFAVTEVPCCSFTGSAGSGYTGITVAPSATPGLVTEARAENTSAVQTATSTWTGGNAAWFGLIIPILSASPHVTVNPKQRTSQITSQ